MTIQNDPTPDASTRRDRVLSLLQRGGWFSGPEIANERVGGSEGLRRLRELRADGWEIDERPVKGSNVHQYRLVGRVASETSKPETAVSVDPRGSGGTQEGLFETVEQPPVPALRAGDYACGKVTSSKPKGGGDAVKTPCLTPFTHIEAVLMDSRFVRGSCPFHGWQEGSLIKGKGLPVGYGSQTLVAPKTTKPRRYRKRK